MDKQLYNELNRLEDHYWWFVARREILIRLLDVYFHHKSREASILDVGCGTGLTLKALKDFGKVYGIDSSKEAVEHAKEKFNQGQVMQSAFPSNPFNKEFDLITMLDVLEHLENDEEALVYAESILTKGGFLLVTVPAYEFLWSDHDEAHEHKRRYTSEQLSNKLTNSGFTLIKISYYNTLLSPPITVARFLKKYLSRTGQEESDLKEYPYLINKLLERIFSFERIVLPYFNLPFGISVLAIAKKQC